MRFILIMFATMFVSRKVGWLTSRRFFYGERGAALWFFLLMWGTAVAWIVRTAIDAGQPAAWSRWIFGYALGAYMSVPNYGLFIESTIPQEDLLSHRVISNAPLLGYILVTTLLATRWIAPLQTMFVIIQWFMFAAVAYGLASRRRRLWRWVGLALAAAFILNALISLADLALIGDPLPGGLPSVPGSDPTHAQAIGEYAGTSLALIVGSFVGQRSRLASVSGLSSSEQLA
jgi:hypothetical protein